MRLYEFEGKSLFKKVGIRIPEGLICSDSTDLKTLGHLEGPWVIKAQVLKGGRGKAGAISYAEKAVTIRKAVEQQLGSTVFNEQVNRVLVERKLDIMKEYYLGITYKGDRPTVIFPAGGVDVEELSRKEPSAVSIEPIDIHTGLLSDQARKLLHRSGVRDDMEELTDIMLKLFKCFASNDALLAEINPLVQTTEGQFFAVDAKMELDDEARFRQTNIELRTGGMSHVRRQSLRCWPSRTIRWTHGALRDACSMRSPVATSSFSRPVEDQAARRLTISIYSVENRQFSRSTVETLRQKKVKGLTRTALMYPGDIHGIWIVGGRANFTDINETIVNGIMAGIRETANFDKRIPIVIRRAGLRDQEAFNTMRQVRRSEKYNIFLRGMETSVGDSAKLLIHHVNNYTKLLKES